jgi:pimeloyl-ACP methyl ester carboxylesterase
MAMKSWTVMPLCLLACNISGAEAPSSVISDPAYTHAQRLVEIQPGRRLNLYCSGRGVPTVLFESGQGDSTRVWGLVQPSVARFTRACSYDRAGIGFSDASTRPRTSANIADDLERLIVSAHIALPLVLVGHSAGGMHMKLFADHHAADVAGMVFVDPSHEDLGRRLWAMDPAYQSKYPEFLKQQESCTRASEAELTPGSTLFSDCVGDRDPRFSQAINDAATIQGKSWTARSTWASEAYNIWFDSADQVRAAARPFGDMPVIVLTHAPFPKTPSETQEMRDAKNQLWLELHRQIAALSTRGRQRTVDGASHDIPFDKPQVVIEAVHYVVEQARSRGKTTPAGTPR